MYTAAILLRLLVEIADLQKRSHSAVARRRSSARGTDDHLHLSLPLVKPKQGAAGSRRACGDVRAVVSLLRQADADDQCPEGVKGGCGRQADGAAGLPSAPEMPCAPRQLRLVPFPAPEEARALGCPRAAFLV
jgi:hypothetical protein